MVAVDVNLDVSAAVIVAARVNGKASVAMIVPGDRRAQ